MKWQEAERELKEWEVEGCGRPGVIQCPITHGSHGSCAGLTLAAHSLMFARIYEQSAQRERKVLAGVTA